MHTISLPDSLHAAAQQQAALAGLCNVDDYVADLVRREAQVQVDGPDSSTVEALQLRKQEIEAVLSEGLDSGPATPMTPEDWSALRQRVEARLAKRNGQ